MVNSYVQSQGSWTVFDSVLAQFSELNEEQKELVFCYMLGRILGHEGDDELEEREGLD